MDHLTEIGNLISESSIFKNIPEEGLREIARIAERKLVPAHTIIFRQGDPGDSLYIINSGAVRVYRKTSKGMETELTVLRDGGHFGELALLTDKPRAGYAETVEESELVVISKDHLDSVLREYPHISSVFINQLSSWIVQSDVKLEEERERQIRGQRGSLFDYIIVLGLSLFLGIGLNFTNPHGIRLIPQFSPIETVGIVTPASIMGRYRTGEAIFVDAMPVNFYNKEHIKSALNLPLALFDIMYILHFSGIEKEKELIVYGRTISRHYDEEVARKLLLNGHDNIRILQGGLGAWKKNGSPTEP